MKKLNIKNILVPIDFSPISIRSISAAEYLAQRFQANIHLANISQDFYPASFFPAPVPIPMPAISYLESVRTDAAQRLQGLAKERGLRGQCIALSGAPVFDEICRIAQQIPADLIVTSTHGYSGLKHVFLGSTAERLVQHSPCPVLVARETKTKSKSGKPGIDRILVPIDFSDCSLAGLKYAIQVADQFAARLTLLHVVNLGAFVAADGYGIYDFSLYQKASADAGRHIRRFVRKVNFGGTKYETVVECALSADAICSVARDKHVDLIITATHGRTGFKHVLIGSTAEVVVRHAPCPVLVVPSHPQERVKHLASRAKRNRGQLSGKALPALSKRVRTAAWSRKSGHDRLAHPFPERRKTNKFRESHLVGLR